MIYKWFQWKIKGIIKLMMILMEFTNQIWTRIKPYGFNVQVKLKT